MAKTVEHKNEEGETVFRIDKTSKTGNYYILAEGNQKENIVNPVFLDGFDRLPTGFYKEGYGLTTAGNFVIQEIAARYSKKVQLTVTTRQRPRIDGRGTYVTVILPQQHLTKLGQNLRTIKRERNDQMRLETQHFLGTTFNQFKDLKDVDAGYTPGKLAEVLSHENILDRLSIEDREALESLIPDYLSGISGTLRAKKKLQVIYDTLDAGKKIYLQKVLKEFRSKLDRKVQSEQSWQDFLSNYILLLQHNYGEVLEKESVSLQGKFPDFMLVDPYGYLDIYEIKRPTTSLLKLDSSRDNYFWDVEVSKAIAQVENYIHQSQRHADSLVNDIRRSKGVEVNIVRPRGYIIAGLRAQLTSTKMQDDFRILRESLKNVDIILYDDLLESLEAFVQRASNE